MKTKLPFITVRPQDSKIGGRSDGEAEQGTKAYEALGMDLIIIALAVAAAIVFAVIWSSKSGKKTSNFPSQDISPRSSSSISVPAINLTSRLPATEVLSRVQTLRAKDAQWDVIWSELNPDRDPEVQRLLVEIRGPNMFAPHLRLSVIEDGCRRVLAASPKADSLAVLHEAIRSQEPFVR